jgi:hypothetical protein
MQLSLIKKQTIVLQRPAVEVFEDMEWKPVGNPPAPTPIEVNLQPFKLNQRRWIAPEGYRVEDLVIVYSKAIQLKTSSVYTKSTADRFYYKGFLYEVIQEQDWEGYGLIVDHYVCMAVKKEPARNPLEEIE